MTLSMDLVAKIRNMVSQVRVTKSSSDSEMFPSAQVSYHKKIVDMTRLVPYPLISNPAVDSLGVKLNIEGQEKNTVCIFHDPQNRLKNLKEGEGGIHNALTGAFVLLDADGNVHVFTDENVIIELNKLSIRNETAELIDLISQMNTAIEAITTNTTFGPTPINNKATFTALQPKIDSFKE